MSITSIPAQTKTRGSKRGAMPVEVARWLVDNWQLSTRDARRMKALNAKVHNETITPQEEKELDVLLDLCLQGDILRAQETAVLMKKRSKRG